MNSNTEAAHKVNMMGETEIKGESLPAETGKKPLLQAIDLKKYYPVKRVSLHQNVWLKHWMAFHSHWSGAKHWR